MKNRTYNILFHTHTVSGIVISVALYVIFFAGSFSFFRDEIVNWERNDIVETTDHMQFNVDAVLDTIAKTHYLYGRDIELKKYYREQQVAVSITASKDSLAPEEAKAPQFFYINTENFEEHSYLDVYSLGEFLYRLHFFAQIPYPVGYYLSGFVALFFLFAIITGVLVHWKKIIANFYVFRPLEKLKTMWTDAHTTLGMLGLPFQFVYAVTGAFFMIKLLLIAPNVLIMYDGDQAKFYEDLGYAHPSFEPAHKKLQSDVSVAAYMVETQEKWSDFEIFESHIFNFGDENMHVLLSGHLPYSDSFNGVGEVIYKANTGKIVSEKNPITEQTYVSAVKNVLYRIHYGDYGGLALKLLSLLLGFVTCFVIISGVMIWLVARDKKNIPEKKRRFNERIVQIYLAICLSMFPITALSFIAVKVLAPASQSFVYTFYLVGWLLLALLFIYKKDNAFTNKMSLLLGSIFGLLVPICNGVVTGNWLFMSIKNGDSSSYTVDLMWLLIAVFGFLVVYKIDKNPEKRKRN
ncbi:PepSY domain-containing protein [Cellulophaga sp. HaHa_2_1]|uniref:PepSY-associated TM helix domain-containing protein n=1 Tax=Cellulophaga sp. HaHa_2_1 TaxID=2749994 RepID=UPI001C4E6B07|nr:PepSY-associated TM helix domain-containing protein [Cellulophaga sp. HaHa_2_1]QXP52595.1 PepSY domain-containing protein [Cellulophaga sp. HaHa_2_1]